MDRIDNFKELRNCLFSDELMLGRINENSFKRIQADFLMTKEMDFGIVELFLRKESPSLTIPVTFFISDTNVYFGHTSKWTILEMREITQTKTVKKVRKREKVAIH